MDLLKKILRGIASPASAEDTAMILPLGGGDQLFSDLPPPPPPPVAQMGTFGEEDEWDQDPPEVDLDPTPDPLPVYQTDDEANAAFISSLWLYINRLRNGRYPECVSDLFTSMVASDIIDSATGRTTRYWWVNANHPIAVIMLDNGEVEEGLVETGEYGACHIFRDTILQDSIASIVDMAARYGKFLKNES